MRTEDAISPHGAQVLGFGDRHVDVMRCLFDTFFRGVVPSRTVGG